MSVSVSSTRTASVLGRSFTQDLSVSADNGVVVEPSLAAAKDGALTTRTDDDTGTLTMDSAGHGIASNTVVDLYWSGGKRVNMTVGTVSGTSVPIDAGTGDVLPAVNTDITAMTPDSELFPVVGNNMAALVANAGARATIRIMDGANTPALLKQIDLDDDADGYVWTDPDDSANPLVNTTAVTVKLSHADSSAARVVRVIAAKND